MINSPEIEELRRLDPVPQPPHDPDQAEQLLRRLLAEPRTRTPRTWPGLRGSAPLLGAALSAAIVAAVFVLALRPHRASRAGHAGASTLLNRAAGASLPRDRVLHEVDISDDPGAPGFYFRTEGWLLPRDGRARTIQISGYQRGRYVDISQSIVTATGREFVRVCRCRSGDAQAFLDGHRTSNELGGPSNDGWKATNGVSGLPGTFARWFRAAYRANALVPDGTSMFDGKRVARFQSMIEGLGPGNNLPTMVLWRPGTAPPESARRNYDNTLTDWYVDEATAQLIGFRYWYCPGGETRSCKGPPMTTWIVTFQRLDPTPQNIALLTGPYAPPGSR